MSKPKTPNQKRKYSELNARLAKYVALVEEIYEQLNLEAAKLVGSNTDYSPDAEVPFKWSDYPQTKKRISDIQEQFVDDIQAVIYRGTSEEWKNSNEVQDLLANAVLRDYKAQVNGKKYDIYYQENSDALKAFQQRKDKGFTISDKLWQQSSLYKQELEESISCAIQKGTSAITLSKQISKYLLDFPQLQKDYKERFGTASTAKDCEYRSIRLARSEINMAYRQAENLRWQQMDFIVGYEIKLSGSHHVHDICDQLKGKYPKSFVWTGWHPNDLCYKVSIRMTDDELDDMLIYKKDVKSVNEVKDVPGEFKEWVIDNKDRIIDAEKRKTLPYFLRDNKLYKDILNHPNLLSKTQLDIFLCDSGDQNNRIKLLEKLYKDKGFSDDEISRFNTLVDFHRHGLSNQKYADFELMEEFWDENSRIGELIRFQSTIEEEVYNEYVRRNGKLQIYRAGTLKRDNLSFTTNKEGVSFNAGGDTIEWTPEHATTVDSMLNDFHLIAGLARRDIGYQGEEELFFIRKVRKYQTKEFAKLEKERRKKEEEKNALKKTDKADEFNKLTTKYMELLMKNINRPDFSEIAQSYTNASKTYDVDVLKKLIKRLSK